MSALYCMCITTNNDVLVHTQANTPPYFLLFILLLFPKRFGLPPAPFFPPENPPLPPGPFPPKLFPPGPPFPPGPFRPFPGPSPNIFSVLSLVFCFDLRPFLQTQTSDLGHFDSVLICVSSREVRLGHRHQRQTHPPRHPYFGVLRQILRGVRTCRKGNSLRLKPFTFSTSAFPRSFRSFSFSSCICFPIFLCSRSFLFCSPLSIPDFSSSSFCRIRAMCESDLTISA